jgi:CRP-like cAMP-binding protein
MLATLCSHPLLAKVDASIIAKLLASGEVVTLKARRTILREGAEADAVYLLLSGGVRVYHRAASGSEVLLKLFRAPALFGEMEVMAGWPYTEHAATTEATQLLRIAAQTFRELLQRSPAFTLALAHDLAVRFCVASQNIKAIAFEEVAPRLANLLLDYAEFSGIASAGGTLIQSVLSQESMARDLAVSRKAVQQALAVFVADGLVVRQSGRYVIANMAALKERAGSPTRVSYSSR